jgi:5-methylcytosine-specific restriction enzyme A
MGYMYINGLEGTQLNSKCVLTNQDELYGMILESWGQKNNPQYNEALKVIISRMQFKGIRKIDVFLASKPVINNFPDREFRRISNDGNGFFDIGGRQPEELRLELCRQQKYFSENGRKELPTGNGSKRIFLHAIELQSESDWKDIIFGDMKNYFESTSDTGILSKRVSLFSKNKIQKPYGFLNPKQVVTQSKAYMRSPEVVAYIIQESNGFCEACFQPAPFFNSSDMPYLEVHHIIPLSEGGPDTPENCVALCPNCHRAMHYAKNNQEIKLKLYHNISRLKG